MIFGIKDQGCGHTALESTVADSSILHLFCHVSEGIL